MKVFEASLSLSETDVAFIKSQQPFKTLESPVTRAVGIPPKSTYQFLQLVLLLLLPPGLNEDVYKQF